MKKTLAVLLAAILLLSLCACGQQEPVDDLPEGSDKTSDEIRPITIVFATPNAEANIESEYAAKWIEAVEDASGGAITFDYTNSGALGSYTELLEGTVNGVYDLTITEPSYIETYVPESSLLSLPMLYSSYEEATEILDGEVGHWYNNLCKEAGLEILNYFYCGFRYIISEDEIKTIDDCDGVIIRSPNIQTYLDTFNMLGFKCETMDFSEAYTAMETGVIQAVECPLQNLYTNGYYNMCPYLLSSRHLLSTNCIVANETFWASLDENHIEILTSTLKAITEEERVECEAREQQFLDDFAAEGTTFNEFDATAQAQILEMFSAYWTKTAEALGQESVDMLNKIIEIKS